jgi:hypothetical protein
LVLCLQQATLPADAQYISLGSMLHVFAGCVCRRFQECLWGNERKVADVDTQGVEDPKLMVWPGKGVYAVFGRKPEAIGTSPYCKDPIFVQFIVQVRGRAPR